MDRKFLLWWLFSGLFASLLISPLFLPGPVFAPALMVGAAVGFFVARSACHSAEREKAVKRARARLFEEEEFDRLRHERDS